jgi:hypothetical protein
MAKLEKDLPRRAPRPDVGRRSRLPIPVRAKIGAAESRVRRLRDVSVSGLSLEWPEAAEPGEPAILRFDGYPGVCEPFILHGRVVRVIEGRSPGVGIAIDRQATPPEILARYRKLVVHYLRHKPLLSELERDFFEGRCESCGWIGRVGARNPTCPRCSERVRPLAED